MIVICEECGKKYRIDPSKIKGKAASFKCRICTHVIMVTKPEVDTTPAAPPAVTPDPVDSDTDENRPPTPPPEIQQNRPALENVITKPPRKRGLFGVRAKMILLFVFIPFVLMIAASLLYLWQLERMSALIRHESTNIVNKMAEEKISDLSTAVANQCRLYLLAHPELQKQSFMRDM